MTEQRGGEIPEMLTSLIKDSDLNGTWKMLIGRIPDPDRTRGPENF